MPNPDNLDRTLEEAKETANIKLIDLIKNFGDLKTVELKKSAIKQARHWCILFKGDAAWRDRIEKITAIFDALEAETLLEEYEDIEKIWVADSGSGQTGTEVQYSLLKRAQSLYHKIGTHPETESRRNSIRDGYGVLERKLAVQLIGELLECIRMPLQSKGKMFGVTSQLEELYPCLPEEQKTQALHALKKAKEILGLPL
jgi:hypothetical protein